MFALAPSALVAVGLAVLSLPVKDAPGFLRQLASGIRRAWAVPVPSSRSRPAAATAQLMHAAGIAQVETTDVPVALAAAQAWARAEGGLVLVCGSLFLAGEALVRLGAYPWPRPDAATAPDPNEQLRQVPACAP